MSNYRLGPSGDRDKDKGSAGSVGRWTDKKDDSVVTVSESTWKTHRETVASSCQTDELKYIEEGSQAIPKGLDKPIQTEEESQGKLETPYPPSLISFFSRVTEQVCEVLQENEDPFLTDIFNEYHEDDDEPLSPESEMIKLFTLKNDKILEESGAYCLAWNKSGSQIAVGYSQETHDGWCSHRMPVSVWSLNQREKVDEKVPQIQLEFTSCISALDFHPQENTVLAIGLHSGEIALADLSFSSFYLGSSTLTAEDNLGMDGASSGRRNKNDCVLEIQSGGHAKEIIALKWIRLSQGNISELFKVHPNGSSYALISAGSDGYISLWSVSKTGSRMFLEKQFIVSSESLSEDIQVGNRYKLGMKELGLTALSSCWEDSTSFVLSTHGSFIFQGFLLNDAQVSDTVVNNSENFSADRALYDPVTNVVVQEIGLIVALDCCPFMPNLFLYLTKEGSCFVQNLLKPNVPTLSIALDVEAVATDVKWSTRPMLIAVTERNFLRFYDFKIFAETSKPVMELEHEEVLWRIAFNKNRNDLVAVGDSTGCVHIWKMPSSLTETHFGEIDDLIHLGQSQVMKEKQQQQREQQRATPATAQN